MNMKKLLLTGLSIAMITFVGFSGLTYAANTPQGKASPEQAQERRDHFRDRLSPVITEYAPELMVDFETIWDQHDAVHEQLTALHETRQSTRQEDRQESMEAYKALIESGQMTREDVKSELETIKAEKEGQRESIESEVTAIKGAYGVDHDMIKGLMDSLKDALDAQDDAAIKTALNQILSTTQTHVESDQAVYNYLLTIE